MAKMPKLMVVHRDPAGPRSKVEGNRHKLAGVESVTWVRTCVNKKRGVRYCERLAPSEKELRKVFSDLEIFWESMMEVEETVPDLWEGRWKAHPEAVASADTLGVI